MNSLLQVKLRFSSEKNKQKPGSRNLRKNAETSIEKIQSLIDDLNVVLRYYGSVPRVVEGILVDVKYNDIVAKSNRIRELLKPLRGNTNDTIVGARFSDAPAGKENHIITHYVNDNTIRETINKLTIAKKLLKDQLGGKATSLNFKKPGCNLSYDGYGLKENQLRDIVIDCSAVDSFSVPQISAVPEKDHFLITIYKTELSLSEIMEKLKIDESKYPYFLFGNDTISVSNDLFTVLNSQIPYLISMVSTDFSKLTFEAIMKPRDTDNFKIPKPHNEPIIGVIDTLFDENVYFSEWVENINYLDDVEKAGMSEDWKEHGTEVASIIVDGPAYNPWLEDGCGRFRVRHFGVCGERISITRLVRKIKEIVYNNPDIHVWNLSLGTEDEVSKNFISYDAAALDEIQSQKNVVFVISGTNDNREGPGSKLRIGSPADSLNAIVVNSVKRDNKAASYTRKGPVLSFFNKPDVCYYGGDYDNRINAYSPHGVEAVYGTSFAAPWISRKVCYLIDVMNLPREVAKALVVDAAAGWEYKQYTYKQKNTLGYGVVPIKINDILSTESNEIRFILYGTSKSYKTTNYAIPVPRDEDGKYPYVARATLCYFPECSRSQGVDYTNRELSLQFGRIDDDGRISDINDNIQDEEGSYVDERQSRKEFRKWENTKLISKVLKKNKPLKSYQDRLWGIAITSKERLRSSTQQGINFGVVITLHELFGVNRIEDFIRACTLRGWIVNEINVQQRIDIYNTNQEEVIFDN